MKRPAKDEGVAMLVVLVSVIAVGYLAGAASALAMLAMLVAGAAFGRAERAEKLVNAQVQLVQELTALSLSQRELLSTAARVLSEARYEITQTLQSSAQRGKIEEIFAKYPTKGKPS